MAQAVRAVYEHGHLRLLDPVALVEGEQVSVTIQSERDRVRAALGDLVAPAALLPDDGLDEEALQREIDAAYQDIPPVSEVIIQGRREGP